MGFFDSIKGFGTSVFETLGAGVQAVLPSFIEAGAGALFSSIFPQQVPAGRQVFSQRPALGPTAGGSRVPQQFFQQPIARSRTFSSQQFQLPGGTPGIVSADFGRQRTTMPHFPGDRLQVTQAGLPLALGALGGALGGFGAAQEFFDIPGIDLQLPFRADARTGGNQFFHGVGQVGQRPRKLIMQINPSSGTPTFFRHAGRPIMFSGDKALCKQVEKIGRSVGRRRPRR